MRLTKIQAAKNRKRIVETASRLFRERGMEGIGLTDLMKEAGFTHGGFYNHFESKEELAAEAVACAFRESIATLSSSLAEAKDRDAVFADSVVAYVAAEHRDARDGGCPTAALPIDASRHGPEVQLAFAEGVAAYLDVMTARMRGRPDDARRRAMALLSGMVGSLILARAVKAAQPELSQALLDSVRDQALAALRTHGKDDEARSSREPPDV